MVCDTQGQLPHELTNAVWQHGLIPHSNDYYMGGHAALHGLVNAMVNCQNSDHSCLPQAATLLNTDSHNQSQAAEVLEIRYSHDYIIIMHELMEVIVRIYL